MSVHMVIEADATLTEAQVDFALTKCGAKVLMPTQGRKTPRGEFPSGMTLFVRDAGRFENVMAGNKEIFPWQVGSRLSFGLARSENDAGNRELACFISVLAECSEAQFVLSYEFGDIYAIRDDTGLRTIRDF